MFAIPDWPKRRPPAVARELAPNRHVQWNRGRREDTSQISRTYCSTPVRKIRAPPPFVARN